ncbi:hypothetical protein L0665_05685 [Methanogenium marinum]|uniref:Uncharacterized protein n=1 Tax=Methanogenium marinum TaxID=348610 RepID=A0A9Q4PY70_9EURY|nr:hypothetical protein [Methanogenium marinum]MDE4908098.1 hypothetical protein [Methanogenium marinum]
MKAYSSIIRKYLICITIVGFFFLVSTASATITFDPFSTIDTTVSPGETVSHTMEIGLGKLDEPMKMDVEVIEDPVIAGDSGSQFSAVNYISLDKSSIILEPGKTNSISAKITVPSNPGGGGRYAIIHFEEVISEEGSGFVGVASKTVINIKVRLTLDGKNLIHEGIITNLESGEATSNQPITIVTTFQNSGNHHFKILNDVDILDLNGEIITTISSDEMLSPILPSQVVTMESSFSSESELQQGQYSFKSRVVSEDGTLIDEKEGSFEIKEAYVPPFQPVTQTITPSEESVLSTDDGRIRVDFPRGALLGAVDVTLEGIVQKNLGVIPDNCALATNWFRISGITGLLAKDATLNVAYCDDDVSIAGGDVGSLILARWDDLDTEWIIYPTSVDKATKTLKTTANQMGTWAVMSASGDVASPQAESTGNTGNTGSQEATPLSPILSLAAVLVVAVGLKMRRER